MQRRVRVLGAFSVMSEGDLECLLDLRMLLVFSGGFAWCSAGDSNNLQAYVAIRAEQGGFRI